jgi:hypothetical protein
MPPKVGEVTSWLLRRADQTADVRSRQPRLVAQTRHPSPTMTRSQNSRQNRTQAVCRLYIARDHLADIRALDARLKFIAAQIAALVTAAGTGLTGCTASGR